MLKHKDYENGNNTNQNKKGMLGYAPGNEFE